MKNNLTVIILAAGKGERMKGAMPKVLHEVCGRPMLSYVLDLVKSLKISQAITVIGHKHAEVSQFLRPFRAKSILQKKLIGTADAVKQALSLLKNFKGDVLILYGDIPLLTKETIKKLLDYHQKNNLDATLLTSTIEKPHGYGRILRDKYATISGIVEEKDADDFQKAIKEINTGIIVFKKEKLADALKYVKANNRKKEYYLTDTIGILYKKQSMIESVKVEDIDQAMGINSRVDLARANKIMRKRINEKLMKEGVSLLDPSSTFINYGAKIGADTTIYPFTVIENDVKIGKRCSIGPFAHLRKGTRLKDDILVGNFVEIVRSEIDEKTLAKHFCYIGDAKIGRSVNIGAGVVTANFNKQKKNCTLINDHAFIGSDTVLVAPVKVGKHAVSGAGSVVLKNIADGTTVVGVPAKLLKLKR